jgi:hypothetical protein
MVRYRVNMGGLRGVVSAATFGGRWRASGGASINLGNAMHAACDPTTVALDDADYFTAMAAYKAQEEEEQEAEE